MGKPTIIRVTCGYYVKANSLEEAQDYVREEAGLDFYERHLIIDEEIDWTGPIDEDLTK